MFNILSFLPRLSLRDNDAVNIEHYCNEIIAFFLFKLCSLIILRQVQTFSFFPHQNWVIVIILTVIVDYFRSNITSHHNSHVLSRCVDVVVIV